MSVNNKIGILGSDGQVGQMVQEIYTKSFFGEISTKDLDHDNLGKKLEVLNICIPYDRKFIGIVVKHIKKHKPEITIIHSTVAPNTTKKIVERTKRCVVHVPVRGIHPRLAESFEKFTKYIGCETKTCGEKAKKHLKYLVNKERAFKVYKPAKITELNKLVSTTYFGVCIAFTDYIDQLFQKHKVPFATFENFNESYNRGYRRLRMRKVNRPTLTPPKGPIGGGCVISNTKLLQKELDHKLIKAILEVK